MGLDPSTDCLDSDRGADEEATAGDIFLRSRERDGIGSHGVREGEEAAWAWDRVFVGRGFASDQLGS